MKKFLSLIIISFFVSGCADTMIRLRGLQLGMTKNEVIEKMGEAESTRASNRFSDSVEIWEYVLRRGGFPPKTRHRYWLFFQKDKLIQWGEENDWGKFEREPDYIEKRIYDDQTDKTTKPRFQ